MITRDLLLAEIIRAVRFHLPDAADEILGHVEQAFRRNAIPGTFPRRRIAKALRAAFPERAASLLAALDRLVPKQSARAAVVRRRVRQQMNRSWKQLRRGRAFPGDFHGQDVPWSTD
jgi:hypothetical protein